MMGPAPFARLVLLQMRSDRTPAPFMPKIKSSQYLIKAFKCGEDELCQRAIDINAACKVHGPVSEVQAFHSKLLSKFASNPQCAITIMRLSDDKSEAAINNSLEAYKRAN
jgi:hypothetical protein